MRIGIDVSALTNKITGTGRYINCLTEQLYTTNHEIELFPRREEIISATQKENLNHAPAVRRGIRKHIYTLLSLPREMNSAGIDCAVFPNYFLPPAFDKPTVIVIHDLSFINHPHFYSKKFVRYYNLRLKGTLRKKPLIATISEHSKNQISSFLGVNKEDILLLQGYSTLKESFDQIRSNGADNTPYFLFVGHVEPRKNLLFLVENFLRWREQQMVDIKLKIAGEMWIKSTETNKLLKKYKDNPFIEFTGFIREDELQKLYTNAAGFVHTSIEEGFGFPVLEAMHYGLPLLCSKGSATEEISKPYSILIDPEDSESLISGLHKLYEKTIRGNDRSYNIKYSPALMRKQLDTMLNMLELKVSKKVPVSIPKSEYLEEAVKKTLLYLKLFNSGIIKDKLPKFLFDRKASAEQVGTAVNNLLAEGIIYTKNDVIYLNSNNDNYYAESVKKINQEKVKRILKLVKLIPFISLISFSGGTAHYGLENHDDIDLFIITKPNTVYIVYFLIHLLSLIIGTRKELCANYLIDEKSMKIHAPRDFYVAHQIISLVPFKNEKMLNYFLVENNWVLNYFPNFSIENTSLKPSSGLYKFFMPVNKILRAFYRLLYRELISSHEGDGSLQLKDCSIKLHTNDNRVKIIKRFEKAWRNYVRVYQQNDLSETEVIYQSENPQTLKATGTIMNNKMNK